MSILLTRYSEPVGTVFRLQYTVYSALVAILQSNFKVMLHGTIRNDEF